MSILAAVEADDAAVGNRAAHRRAACSRGRMAAYVIDGRFARAFISAAVMSQRAPRAAASSVSIRRNHRP